MCKNKKIMGKIVERLGLKGYPVELGGNTMLCYGSRADGDVLWVDGVGWYICLAADCRWVDVQLHGEFLLENLCEGLLRWRVVEDREELVIMSGMKEMCRIQCFRSYSAMRDGG